MAAAATATNQVHESKSYVVIVPQRKEHDNGYSIYVRAQA